jgi:hypothetical protein
MAAQSHFFLSRMESLHDSMTMKLRGFNAIGVFLV